MDIFVFKYIDGDKEYFYYVDDIEGDKLVDDIDDAKLFTNKQASNLEGSFRLFSNEKIFSEPDNSYIILKSGLVKVKVQ